MDFSSIPRALDSLRRRQPPLPESIIRTANDIAVGDGDLFSSLTTLLTESHSEGRWEPLAVGLYVATEIVQHHQCDVPNGVAETAPVYMDGPRVPSMVPTTGAVVDMTAAALYTRLSTTAQPMLPQLCRVMHTTCLQQLEHKEPRVRTLVAKAVGAYSSRSDAETAAECLPAMQGQLVTSIQEHIAAGRDEHGNYSRTSTGAVDDTTGWRALETNWLCLASMVNAMSYAYIRQFPVSAELLRDCEFSSVTHVNRHVRAAAMQTLEQWVRAVTVGALMTPNSNDASVETTTSAVEAQRRSLTEPTSALRMTVIAVVKAGLADNWSQVRMAGSVLCRVWFTSLKAIHADVSATDMTSALLPRMCLNRFYLAQGVKLYSHETWKLLFPDGTGLILVAENLAAVCRYYVKMCDADNHVVREGACQAIAELAVRLGDDVKYHDMLLDHMDMLLKSLLMCFFDESWPVRDEACLACGILCKAYPDACKPEFKTLWERWTEQLTDQIWSVREDAAVALGDALEAYGDEVMVLLRTLLRDILPAARNQPAMTATEYKDHVNNAEQHTDSTLYSCGSLAPKLRKGGAGRIGCSNCGVDRPKAPWEATDGCIYLIRELVIRGTMEGTTTPLEDGELVPLLQELADVCRVQHFPQADDLRTTLWKAVPTMAHALGKQRFKARYLDIFLDLLFSNLESRSANQLSVYAAGQCAEELAFLVDRGIFRGRLDDDQRHVFDRVMHERELMPKGPGAGDVFSPFGPPGLLDAIKP